MSRDWIDGRPIVAAHRDIRQFVRLTTRVEQEPTWRQHWEIRADGGRKRTETTGLGTVRKLDGRTRVVSAGLQSTFALRATVGVPRI
jgi:hypothetical protein